MTKKDTDFQDMSEKEARQQILAQVKAYCRKYHLVENPFSPGDSIRYAGRNYDEKELMNAVDSCLEFWLTARDYANELENKLATYLGVKYCGLVNSGSSANLLAFMTLTAPELKKRAIRRGDEVITVAAAFPTTVAPIIQYGAVPVFIDIQEATYNVDINLLEQALSKKTKAVFLAHTLGIPFDVQRVKDFCDQHGLWLIEDNCDALGAEIIYNGEKRLTGTIGDISTSSFYPAHHMTTGEGGAVYTNNPLLHRLFMSYRDWGRDCRCPGGMDNVCRHRYNGQYGELPIGYDHKYVYSHFGYNLKLTEMQAAIGCAQIDKVPLFVKRRRENGAYLYEHLASLEDKLILPEIPNWSQPSWFGFPISTRKGVSRARIVHKLETNNIQTRNLFAGNIVKHPCFDTLRQAQEGYRVAGNLTNTDKTVENTFWIGVHPGMTKDMLDYMIEMIEQTVQ